MKVIKIDMPLFAVNITDAFSDGGCYYFQRLESERRLIVDTLISLHVLVIRYRSSTTAVVLYDSVQTIVNARFVKKT